MDRGYLNMLETLRHTHPQMLTTFCSEFTPNKTRSRETTHGRHCDSSTTTGSAQRA